MRVNDVRDNLTKSYRELKYYEDDQRGQTDPGSKFRNDEKIEQLNQSIHQYEGELERLQAKISDFSLKVKLEQEVQKYKTEEQVVNFIKPDKGKLIPFVVIVLPDRKTLIIPRTDEQIDTTKSIQPLIHNLTNGEPEQQTRAAHILAEYPYSSAIEEALINIVTNSKSPQVKAVIADILGEKKSVAAVPILSRFLWEDEDDIVRNNAAIALAEIGTSSEVSTQLADAILTSNKFEDLTKKFVGKVLAFELISIATHIWHTLKHDKTVYLIHTLNLCLPYIFPYLLEALTNDKERIRHNAWEIFEELYSDIKYKELISITDLITVLRNSIQDTSWDVRYHTIHILAEMRDEAALPILYNALEHGDVNTRPYAAFWLAENYRKRVGVLGYLIDSYNTEKDHDVKTRIGWLLGNDRPQSWLQKKIKLLGQIIYWSTLVIMVILFRTGYINDLAQLDDENPWKWASFAVFFIYLILVAMEFIGNLRVSFLVKNDDRFWNNKIIK